MIVGDLHFHFAVVNNFDSLSVRPLSYLLPENQLGL